LAIAPVRGFGVERSSNGIFQMMTTNANAWGQQNRT
jgi:hypothetical protein